MRDSLLGVFLGLLSSVTKVCIQPEEPSLHALASSTWIRTPLKPPIEKFDMNLLMVVSVACLWIKNGTFQGVLMSINPMWWLTVEIDSDSREVLMRLSGRYISFVYFCMIVFIILKQFPQRVVFQKLMKDVNVIKLSSVCHLCWPLVCLWCCYIAAVGKFCIISNLEMHSFFQVLSWHCKG